MKLFTKLFALCAVLILLTSSAVFANPLSADQLKVTVLDKANNAPISGASVSVKYNDIKPSPKNTDASGNVVFSNASSFEVIEDVSYLSVAKSGYLSYSFPKYDKNFPFGNNGYATIKLSKKPLAVVVPAIQKAPVKQIIKTYTPAK